jgi:hypothetical protein
MRVALVLLAGCWTGTPSTPKPTRCEIRERLVETSEPATLSVRGQVFAKLAGPFVRLDVTVTGGQARGELETDQLTLNGELALDHFAVRPKHSSLHDGWLEVTHGIGRAALDSSLRIEVDLPEGMQPTWTSIDLPCDALTFAKRNVSYVPDVLLAAGTSATLYREPGAKPIGQWTAPEQVNEAPSADLDAMKIDERDGYLRIRIQGNNAVIAWVSQSAVQDRSDDIYGGLLGEPTPEIKRMVQCSGAQPIYVRVDNLLERVGMTKPGSSFAISGVRGHEIGIELGSTEVTPFLDRRDAMCKPAP